MNLTPVLHQDPALNLRLKSVDIRYRNPDWLPYLRQHWTYQDRRLVDPNAGKQAEYQLISSVS